MLKAAYTKHQISRLRSRMKEIIFSTFDIRTASIKGDNSIGHIDCLLRLRLGCIWDRNLSRFKNDFYRFVMFVESLKWMTNQKRGDWDGIQSSAEPSSAGK